MYMRNNRSAYDKYSKYNIGDFPANYSGQYKKNPMQKDEDIIETSLGGEHDNNNGKFEKKDNPESVTEHGEDKSHRPHSHSHESHKPKEEVKKESRNSLIGGLFRGDKDGHKGILGKIFGEKDGKGILGGLELEDLILLAVIFFLLKDGIEDDFLFILALILLA